jgi:hypothetical protein
MKKVVNDSYRDWDITISAEHNMCSNFCFDITDPSGRTQHVSMGGDNEQSALEKAREMIEMEIALSNED